MLHRYKLACLLLIFGFSGNINCGEGKTSPWIIGTAFCSGITVVYMIGKDAYSHFTANPKPKNVIITPVTLTPEQIEFEKVQKFLNNTKLEAVNNNDHLKSDFNEFRNLAGDTNNKIYTVELSKVLLDCVQNDSKKSELRYEHYSHCLSHTNNLAKNKNIPQPEPENQTNQTNQTNDDNNNHQD
jgi:hypothetical protein